MNSIVKSTLVLLLGFGLAQLVLLVGTPFLTRLYNPSQFGIYGVIFSLSIMFLSLTSLRFEYAIPLVKRKHTQAVILQLCVYLTVVISILLFFCFIIWHLFTGSQYNLSMFEAFICLCLIVLQGLCQIYSLPFIEQGDNTRLSIGKLIQNVTLIAVQVLFAFVSHFGLIIGLALGLIANIIYFVHKNHLPKIKNILIKKSYIGYIFKRFYQFPLYSSWAGVIDAAAVALPTLMIGLYFNKMNVGLYFLVYRIFMAPIGLLSKAVSYVATKEFSAIRHANNIMLPLFIRLSFGMLIISLLYFTCMYGASFYAEILFGRKWSDAGPIIRLLAYVIPLIGIASPLSIVFIITEKNKISSVWQILYLLSTLFVLLVHGKLSFYDYILRLVIVWAVMYIIYWSMSFYCIYSRDKKLCAV